MNFFFFHKHTYRPDLCHVFLECTFYLTNTLNLVFVTKNDSKSVLPFITHTKSKFKLFISSRPRRHFWTKCFYKYQLTLCPISLNILVFIIYLSINRKHLQHLRERHFSKRLPRSAASAQPLFPWSISW